MARYEAGKVSARLVSEVWLDGEEVAHRTRACDTDEGWVDVFVKRDGKFVLGPGGPIVERIYGDVKVVLGDDE